MTLRWIEQGRWELNDDAFEGRVGALTSLFSVGQLADMIFTDKNLFGSDWTRRAHDPKLLLGCGKADAVLSFNGSWFMHWRVWDVDAASEGRLAVNTPKRDDLVGSDIKAMARNFGTLQRMHDKPTDRREVVDGVVHEMMKSYWLTTDAGYWDVDAMREADTWGSAWQFFTPSEIETLDRLQEQSPVEGYSVVPRDEHLTYRLVRARALSKIREALNQGKQTPDDKRPLI